MSKSLDKEAFLQQNLWRVKRGSLPLEWSKKLKLLCVIRCWTIKRKEEIAEPPKWYRVLRRALGGSETLENCTYGGAIENANWPSIIFAQNAENERNMRDIDMKLGACAVKSVKKKNETIWVFYYKVKEKI